MPLCRLSVGTYPETNSHATCQGTFGYSPLSSLSHCELILAQRWELVCATNLHLKKKKKEKKRRQEMNGPTFFQNARKRG